MTTKTATRERPILFSGEMIRAILAGRKTMTRRVVKMDGVATIVGRDAGGQLDPDAPREIPEWQIERLIEHCPYGQPGDRLWVRETWAIEDESKLKLTEWEGGRNPDWIYYRDAIHECTGLRWHPSIFMPRWASRITLEITSVRVERLQSITEEDAIAEGCFTRTYRDGRGQESARHGFLCLWDDLNANTATWKSNPFVWVISFQRIKP